MKIVQVVHSFPPAIGGVERHVFCLSEELVKLGHEVTIFTSSEFGTKTEEIVSGVKVKRLPALILFGFSSVRFSPMLLFELLRTNADIYCGQSYGSLHPFFAALAAFLKRKPFVFTIHGYPKMKGLAGVLQFLYKVTLARFFFNVAKKIITVTSTNIPLLKNEVNLKKVIVIPNGVDTKFFRPIKKFRLSRLGAGPVISYIGRLDEYKGIDTLIRAFKKTHEKIPSSILLIIGKDEGIKEELTKLAYALGISEYVRFMEAKFSEMPKIYSMSDLVVLPSRYEGLSFVMLEVLACEKPLVSTRVGAAEEILQKAYGKYADDFLFEVDDANGLARKILDYFAKKQKKYEKIFKDGRVLVKKEFSWPAVAEKTLKIYNEAMKRCSTFESKIC